MIVHIAKPCFFWVFGYCNFDCFMVKYKRWKGEQTTKASQKYIVDLAKIGVIEMEKKEEFIKRIGAKTISQEKANKTELAIVYSEKYNLHDCYKKCSLDKVKAFAKCKEICETLEGLHFRIIGNNTFSFSVGFIFYDDLDRKRIAKITKNNIYISKPKKFF